ncbi:MAG: TIGR01244 family sulfur transferase [Pseudomonadota bacterium]
MKRLFEQIYVAGQLGPEDFAKAAAAGIKTIINNRPDGEEPGQLDHQQAEQLAADAEISYHYLPMENGKPLPPTLVEDFKAVLDNTNEPVLAHCRSGMRSSFIWALGQIGAGEITPDEAINAATNAGIPLNNARAVLESVAAS